MTKRILSAALALAVSLALASPAFAGETESPFSDVSVTHWAFSYIQQAYDEQIISGMGDGTFAPDGQLTAAQFATIVTKAFYWRELSEIKTAQTGSDEDWSAPYRLAAEQAGLMENTGVEDWNSPMTRYQMAQMLYNIAADKELEPPAAASIGIADLDQVPEQYKEAVKSAYALGLLSGMEDGSFAGDQTLIRAQAAVVFAKLDQALATKAGPMEWTLDKAERDAKQYSFLSTTFTRYPGPKGTVYVCSQGGLPHGPSTRMVYVYQNGSKLDIGGLLPRGYRLSDYLNPSEIQFDETGDKLTFVTPVEEGIPNESPGPDNPSMWLETKDWGPTRCTVDLTSGTLESMEPLEERTPEKIYDADGNNHEFLLFKEREIVYEDGMRGDLWEDNNFPWDEIYIIGDANFISVVNPHTLLSYSKFADSGYGQAIRALQALDLPYGEEGDPSVTNTPEQREQAGKYFQVRLNGELVSGKLVWTDEIGLKGSGLCFVFDEPILPPSPGNSNLLELWVGVPQEE